MTDFRGTEQELWDEQAIPEEERDTLIFGQRAGHVAASAEAPPTDGEAVPAVASAPDARAQAEVPVDSVARFIAEPGQLLPSPERELDAPRRSLAALELLDADEGAEASDLRAPPLPPALPADVKPATAPEGSPSTAPSGPVRSSRGDVTERVTTIPRTHPMANSIAPGGSPLSTPPRSARRAARWQIPLGVAALLMIGVTARLLQSRGEHHAASGARGGESDEAALDVRRAVPTVGAHDAEQAAREAAERAAAEAALMSVAATEPQPPTEEPSGHGDVPGAQKPNAVKGPRAAADAAERTARRRVRVGVGGAQLLNKDATAPSAEELERGRIVQALTALTPRLRDCVGDEHGIADVTITVRAPGVISHALVQGPYAGSDKGSCIARALRTAKLPPLQDAVSRIEYPFQL